MSVARLKSVKKNNSGFECHFILKQFQGLLKLPQKNPLLYNTKTGDMPNSFNNANTYKMIAVITVNTVILKCLNTNFIEHYHRAKRNLYWFLLLYTWYYLPVVTIPSLPKNALDKKHNHLKA